MRLLILAAPVAVICLTALNAEEPKSPCGSRWTTSPAPESDNYFAKFAKEGGFGKFHHERVLAEIDNQTVIRLNRDTLYSFGVFDLDASPVTVTLPDAGKRYMAIQVINEDHYAAPT